RPAAVGAGMGALAAAGIGGHAGGQFDRTGEALARGGDALAAGLGQRRQFLQKAPGLRYRGRIVGGGQLLKAGHGGEGLLRAPGNQRLARAAQQVEAAHFPPVPVRRRSIRAARRRAYSSVRKEENCSAPMPPSAAAPDVSMPEVFRISCRNMASIRSEFPVASRGTGEVGKSGGICIRKLLSILMTHPISASGKDLVIVSR